VSLARLTAATKERFAAFLGTSEYSPPSRGWVLYFSGSNGREGACVERRGDSLNTACNQGRQIQGRPPILDLEFRQQQGVAPAVDGPIDHAYYAAVRAGRALPSPGLLDREGAHPLAQVRERPVRRRTQPPGLGQHLGRGNVVRVPLNQECDLPGLGAHTVRQDFVSAVQARQPWRGGQGPGRPQHSVEHKREPRLGVPAAQLEFGGQAPTVLAQLVRHHPVAIEAPVAVVHHFLARPGVVLGKQVHVQRGMLRLRRGDRHLQAPQKGLVRGIRRPCIVHREGILALGQTRRRDASLESQRRQKERVRARALDRSEVALAQQREPGAGGENTAWRLFRTEGFEAHRDSPNSCRTVALLSHRGHCSSATTWNNSGGSPWIQGIYLDLARAANEKLSRTMHFLILSKKLIS